MLDSLELFLSTFQKDLSAVSGQISELQERSKDIENRLKNRRVGISTNCIIPAYEPRSQKIEKPLSKLLSEITIPPEMISVIIDTDVGDPWLTVIPDFEERLVTSRARARVKAARDLGDVFEAVRIVVSLNPRQIFSE
jgi:vacuolar protein sorting-associated protein 52